MEEVRALNLFDLYAKVVLDTDEYEQGLERARGASSDFAGKLGSGISTAAKTAAAGVAAATTAVAAFTKQAVDAFAQYEQLIGGTELMLGSAYDDTVKRAQNAYKTVQMSQIEYLQQVNGFATGLKTALDGDEKAASELADRIITAQADIIAATGQSQEAVQNAFNGIMKSNFTMLDNLQLGITPTKEGFQEIIDKVNEWNASNGEATEYQMGNLADMQSALVDYVDMVGMAGYASKEASGTISGSMASAKAAWQNLVVGIASGNQDIGSLMGSFAESVSGVAGNILPVVEQVLGGLETAISSAGPMLEEAIPVLVDDVIPTFLDAGGSLLGGLVDGILNNADSIISGAASILGQFTSRIAEGLPEIVNKGFDIVVSLGNGIVQFVDELVPAAASMIDGLVSSLTDPENLDKFAGAALNVVESLGNAIVVLVPKLATSAVQLLQGFFEYLTTGDGLSEIVGGAGKIVGDIVSGLIASVPKFIAEIGNFCGELVRYILKFEWISVGWEIVKEIVGGLFSGLYNVIKENASGLFGEGAGSAMDIGLEYFLHGENNQDYDEAVKNWAKQYHPDLYEQEYGALDDMDAAMGAMRPKFTTGDFLNYDVTPTEYVGPSGWGPTMYVQQVNNFDSRTQSPSEYARASKEALEEAMR